MHKTRCSLALPAALAFAAACSSPSEPAAPRRVKAACAEHNPERNVYWGDLHDHTAYSFDAYIFETRNTPVDAYRFAKGEEVALPPLDESGNGTHKAKLARPLDFAAVTDHSEFLGEVNLCLTPGSPGYDSKTCVAYRKKDLGSFAFWGLTLTTREPNRFSDECGAGGANCTARAKTVWQREIEAAEDAYDWSSACKFTSFIAYEYTAVPGLSNLHRNVIFRNDTVPDAPVSYIDAPGPTRLWERLKADCLDKKNGCDVLAIPHNSNLSNGNMFSLEYQTTAPLEEQRAAAAFRVSMEPIMEIFQHKGDSECINGLGGIFGSPDELCNFEKVTSQTEDCGDGTGSGGMTGAGCVSVYDFARGALLRGLKEDARLGVNPFELGFIGSTDTHNGTPGNVDETTFQGHVGVQEGSPEARLAGGAFPLSMAHNNPGGLAGVWAEENSRDSIFDALRRRETFATSGPRIAVRFFGGWKYPASLCADPDLVKKGYAGGVPMGGELPAASGGATAPTFVVSALKDPGTAAQPGTQLQRIQIVKGWIENGEQHEQVFEAAGNPNNGATVDTNTCRAAGTGYDSLCAVWRDPQFVAGQHAFYYARVVENPTCRWSQMQCLALPAASRPATCTDPSYTKVIQERAWSSPIWYRP